jgi:hypothetical protein
MRRLVAIVVLGILPCDAYTRLHPSTVTVSVRQSTSHLLRTGRIRACTDDETARAQRRRDADSLRSEFEGGSELVEESMATLREYMNVIEEKETKLSEIVEMLRVMQVSIGVPLVRDSGEVLPTAWVFVGLNVVIALYVLNGLLVDPIMRYLASIG